MRHLIKLSDLKPSEIEHIIDRSLFFYNQELQMQKNAYYDWPNADVIHTKKGSRIPLFLSKNLFACNFFLENSTRTRLSFEIAQKKLGIQSIDFKPESSSLSKGESFYDSLKSIESLGAKFIVVRSSMEQELAKHQDQIHAILINAGEGKSEHPTQALLDYACLKNEFHNLNDLKLCIVGDLKHSRVFSSHFSMAKYLGIKLSVSGPMELIPDYAIPNYISVDNACESMDAVMFLRHQKERHQVNFDQDYNYLETFGFNSIRLRKLKSKAIIMHPGPFNRNHEIESGLVEADCSRIFLQKTLGVYTRMAVLEFLIKENL